MQIIYSFKSRTKDKCLCRSFKKPCFTDSLANESSSLTRNQPITAFSPFQWKNNQSGTRVSALLRLPVMAAVAVRKKVVSIGHFSQVFYLLDQIKSNCMYWLHWKLEKNRTEPNELVELKCSKSLDRVTSYAQGHAFLYLHAHIKTLFFFLIYSFIS